MLRPVDLMAELAGRPILGRRDENASEAAAAFAVLAAFRDRSIFAGSFAGESPRERHRNGGERVPRRSLHPSIMAAERSGLDGAALEPGLREDPNT
jgi:hypothetical protein